MSPLSVPSATVRLSRVSRTTSKIPATAHTAVSPMTLRYRTYL
ncbi:hypothetical protein GBAR_LOCUS29116 [Geodia barretti]|uniref:Uncharacterized protein n=1 Tax=Geodia barretti TaxID=519541 RepID=A0AA35XC43_GEOBA|nr:hypothetical protein GBAR_LOCUS29116 [Geodia barretti]